MLCVMHEGGGCRRAVSSRVISMKIAGAFWFLAWIEQAILGKKEGKKE